MRYPYGHAAIHRVANAQVAVFIPPKHADRASISDDDAVFGTAPNCTRAAAVVHTCGQCHALRLGDGRLEMPEAALTEIVATQRPHPAFAICGRITIIAELKSVRDRIPVTRA